MREKLQFTIEIEGEKLNFLDITPYKKDNIVEFNWYYKQINILKKMSYLSVSILFLEKEEQ